jgi:hypothetical protein
MRIKSGLFIALIFLLAVMAPAVQAGLPQQQTAAITSFTTTAQSSTRTELSLNTARVPVTWEVTNRPANSNLVFEQVFTDGRVQNVELPRNLVIVDSSGVGVVAPVNPGTDEIVIQVRLVDLASNATYAQRQFTLPINDDPVQGPSIESFTSTRTSVSMAELNNGVLIPVSWQVLNYLPQSNLVFDQVLPNGQAVNVELPRSFLIVPPQGNGIVAPRLPGGDNDALVLRLRSVDLLPTPRVEGGIFSEAELTIDITNERRSLMRDIRFLSRGGGNTKKPHQQGDASDGTADRQTGSYPSIHYSGISALRDRNNQQDRRHPIPHNLQCIKKPGEMEGEKPAPQVFTAIPW